MRQRQAAARRLAVEPGNHYDRDMKTHLNPAGLPANPAFSQVVVVERPDKTVYVGGQNALSADGEIVGDSLREQTSQALRNVQTALAAAGASMRDVVRLTINVVDGHDIREGFAAFQELDEQPDPPPTISVLVVSGLANPRFLIEIDAVAVI